jgi:hypothetical protein
VRNGIDGGKIMKKRNRIEEKRDRMEKGDEGRIRRNKG